MIMLDICAGLGGASQAMKDRGWTVVTLDNNPKFGTEIVADIRTWSWRTNRPDLIWCSPPCTEFAREFMPWCKTGEEPDLSILKACTRIIDQANPRYWVIENVKGALKWFEPILGKPSYVCNPYYLWGHFPSIDHVRVVSHKESLSSSQDAERGLIPYRLSNALAEAIERQPQLIESEAI
jgi:hypothetical protein